MFLYNKTGDKMKCIKNEVKNEIIINKSKFITFLHQINNTKEVNNYLKKYKEKYKNATHICYGYILDNYEKYSDDKEPSGTAGKQILNVLKQNNLNHILCIVIRYFGGIKLGTGGLTRAYSNSTNQALNKAEIKPLIQGYQITIKFDYKKIKQINNKLKEYKIKKEFDNQITYIFNINKNEIDNILPIIKENIIKKEPIYYIK